MTYPSVTDELCNRITQQVTRDVEDKYTTYNCSRRPDFLNVNSHRKGPLPIEDCVITKYTQASTCGTLDSDCEELDFERLREKNSTSVSSRVLPMKDRGTFFSNRRKCSNLPIIEIENKRGKRSIHFRY